MDLIQAPSREGAFLLAVDLALARRSGKKRTFADVVDRPRSGHSQSTCKCDGGLLLHKAVATRSGRRTRRPALAHTPTTSPLWLQPPITPLRPPVVTPGPQEPATKGRWHHASRLEAGHDALQYSAMADGRIAEELTCGDSLGRMKQLGMLPTPATGSATGGSSAGGTAR
jgi:hypothetical protein